MSKPRIFVNIASYRDTECQWTVKDLFEKARHPERVFVGICWQFMPKEDDDCFLVRTRPEQCRVIEVDVRRSSHGVCWARSQVQSLWRGEEYTFQIDSHMRLVQDWDEVLLDMLSRCPSPRPVLSSYPCTYEPPDKLGPPLVARMEAREFDLAGMLRLNSTGLSPKDFPKEPVASAFCAAGMLFGPAEIIRDVPYDPHIYFLGEEITLAARLWTSGWDIFMPTAVIAYHDYTASRPGRHRPWSDSAAGPAIERSYRRVRHLLGTRPCDDPEALRDIERYGFGSARSFAEYQEFARVDFAGQRINGKSMPEVEAAFPKDYRRRRMEEYYTGIHRMASADAIAAAAKSAEAVAAGLGPILEFLGIANLIDAGCGRGDWIAPLLPRLNLYLGFDINDNLIEAARKRHSGHPNVHCAVADITADALPRGDAILCRDVLPYMPLPLVSETLGRFKASGTRYLIATTFDYGLNQMVRIGGRQPIDLTAAPFELPRPAISIPDPSQERKSLAVWRIADLPTPA